MNNNFYVEYNKNILIAHWNNKERSVNIIDEPFMVDLEHLIDHAVADTTIKGVVLISDKKEFSAGADLNMLQAGKKRYEDMAKNEGEEIALKKFLEFSSSYSRLLRKMETCGKPFVCIIHGICFGGAFELALACHHRIMLTDSKTKVGLPEVTIGLFPGAGGTTRVARLMDTENALKFLLKGAPVDSTKALKMGLVDELCDENPVQHAINWITEKGDPVARWDKKDFKNPSGKVFSPKGMMTWTAANALYRKETYNNYPGARAILINVYEGLQVPIDTAFTIESRWFAYILRTKEAEGMIKTLFLSKNELDKGARRPKDQPPTNIQKVGVIGAGFMGAGIAYVTAKSGLDVVLLDTSIEKVETGIASIKKILDGQVSRGKITKEQMNGLLDRIETSIEYKSLKDVDLVVEAVFEDRSVKENVLKAVVDVVKPNTIIATNTSTLPVSSLADYVSDPGNFIGIHFFSPVDKMMLVEIIKGVKTNDFALATALDFVRKIRKTPIVVNDSRGFYANRCVMAYVLEGHLMLNEGVPPAMIESAARMAGMPVGPLALNDEVGIDLAWKILQATKKDLGKNAINPIQESMLQFMIDNERYGKKNGKGFYDYEDGQKKLWKELVNKSNLVPEDIDIEELKQRFLFVQSIEALKTMKEGVVTDQREADVGSIFGFGFPPFTGGTISFVDWIGKDEFLKIQHKLETKFGSRFSVEM